jgi:transcriptional regulator with XRE-family HTH domain
MTRKKRHFSDQIRQAVDASGKSRYRLCKEIGVDQSTLSRFMSGERGLTTPVLDRLADALGLEIVTRPPTKKGK